MKPKYGIVTSGSSIMYANLHHLWLTRFLVKAQLIQKLKVWEDINQKNTFFCLLNYIIRVCVNTNSKFVSFWFLDFGHFTSTYLGASSKLVGFLVICTRSFKFLIQAVINLADIADIARFCKLSSNKFLIT